VSKRGGVPIGNPTGFHAVPPGERFFKTGDQNGNYIIPSRLPFSLSLYLLAYRLLARESVAIALSTFFNSNFVFE